MAKYVQVKGADGSYAAVNVDYLDKYKNQGYTTDLDAPLDYSKLPSISVYRKENADLVNFDNVVQQSVNRNGKTTNVGRLIPRTKTYTNSINMINSQSNDPISALRKAIQQNIANRKAQSQPLINNSEIQKAQELRAVLEQNANAGDRGGVGRQNALETKTAGDNRINSIKLAEAQDIGNIQTDATVQEAQIRAQQMRDAIEQQRYEDEMNLRRDEINYNREQTEQDRKVKDFLDTIGQYSGDYQARINQIRNDSDSSNDWQLDYLNAAREDKIRQQEAVEAAAAAARAKQEEAAIKAETALAWDKWTKNAPLSLREYQLLGIAPGTRYTPPKNTTPVSKPSSGSGSSGYGLNW